MKKMSSTHQHKTKAKKSKERERTDTDTVKKPGHKQKSINGGNRTRRQKYCRPEEGRRRTRRRKQACNRATEHDADKPLKRRQQQQKHFYKNGERAKETKANAAEIYLKKKKTESGTEARRFHLERDAMKVMVITTLSESSPSVLESQNLNQTAQKKAAQEKKHEK
jgi:hypothetical protein